MSWLDLLLRSLFVGGIIGGIGFLFFGTIEALAATFFGGFIGTFIGTFIGKRFL